jgi:prenylcysteine oxidase/farnesylcysteine lyase
MMLAVHSALLLLQLLISSVLSSQKAFQAKPRLDSTHSALYTDNDDVSARHSMYNRVRRVAIIGAGAGGSSASYFLSKANQKLESLGYGSEGIDVTVFERDERIGGRTTVIHPYDDERYPAIEVGASIFADVNKNLQRASKEFNLSTGAKLGEDGITGIWDGQQFLVEGLDNGWWNSAKMFWRYGYAPVTTQKLVRSLVDSFLMLYDPSWMHRRGTDDDSGFPWSSIERLSTSLHLNDLASQNAGDYFYGKGVSKLFVEEVIEAATLVNYGQEVFSLHGVGGSVSLAATGATGVVGGNYKIFEEMLARCNALRLRLGIHGEVTGLARFRSVGDAISQGQVSEQDAKAMGYDIAADSEQSTKWWLGTKSGYGGLFDAIFIATPWQQAGITLLNTHTVIPTPEYVHLHVTILVTDSQQPDPRYFGRGEKDAIPNSILTSHIALRKEKEEKEREKRRKDKNKDGKQQRMVRWWPWNGGNGEKRGPHLDFNSLSYLSEITARDDETKKEHVVKLFSAQRLSDEQLDAIFGPGRVRWTYRKEWDAYPYLVPKTSFPKLQADDNLYFLNAMESLISTMETATVSSRNAVALYLQQEFGSDFVNGGKSCPWEGDQKDEDQADWAAWGCQSA